MTIISGDWETYYSRDYSLTKMSEAEYILDDRFEAIMLALKIDSGPSVVHIGQRAIEEALAQLDWANIAWLSHNTRFDGSILAWRYGYVPKLYLDTLSMARAITHWVLGKSSLKAVSKYLELPPKGDEVLRAQDKRLADFTPEELSAYSQYCARDNDNCYDIFNVLRGCFQNTELQLIDLILRMYIIPQVQLDPAIIEEHLAEVRAEKQLALEQVAGIDKEHFSSNQKFAELLTRYGVTVPTKISPTTGSEIPALARGDWDFKELCADPSNSPFVQALLSTRRSVKSTIDETRAEALLRISKLTWPTQGTSWAPVPLKFSGARTHRLSGDGGINFQNIRRGSSLRRALHAPDGYRIVHRDASQIEARMVAWMSWCLPLMSAFATNQDVYSAFASRVYGRTITKEDKLERFVGKTGVLGLGYGCGPARYRHMLFIGSGGLSVQIEPVEAEFIVSAYRDQFPEIVDLWKAFNYVLINMIGNTTTIGLRHSIVANLPIKFSNEAIWLPNGLSIQYPNLGYSYTEDGREICYDDPYGGRRKIYGAKVVENISQALARIVVTDIAVRVYQVTGYSPWLSTHDSLDYCVPLSEAEDMDAELARQFAIRPVWADELPLASEGGWGKSLYDAERGANT
jgi:DNA polymerase bacteriophage-type